MQARLRKGLWYKGDAMGESDWKRRKSDDDDQRRSSGGEGKI
jgi:hypothetical protein